MSKKFVVTLEFDLDLLSSMSKERRDEVFQKNLEVTLFQVKEAFDKNEVNPDDFDFEDESPEIDSKGVFDA